LIQPVDKQTLVAKQAVRTGRVVGIRGDDVGKPEHGVVIVRLLKRRINKPTLWGGNLKYRIMFEIEYEVKNEKYHGHPRLRSHYCRCILPILKPEGMVSNFETRVRDLLTCQECDRHSFYSEIREIWRACRPGRI
jgi:hypothetical protein